MFHTKMSRLVLIISSVFIVCPVLISGNVIPINSAKPISDQWILKEAQRDNNLSAVQQKQVQTYPTYQPIKPDPYNAVRLRGSNYDDLHRLSGGFNGKQQQLNHPLPKPERMDFHVIPADDPEESKQHGGEFKEKLDFGILSSLLPTSILNSPQNNPEDEENLIETDSERGQFQGDSGPQDESQNQEPDQDHNTGPMSYESTSSSEQFTPNQESSVEVDSGSDNGLISRIRNVLPFGNGFLSGLLSNENNNYQEETADTYVQDDNGGDTSYNLPAINNMFANEESSVTNTFSLNPSQTTLTNHEIENEGNESGESGSNFLSSLRNPFTRFKNLLSSITPQDSSQQPETAEADVQDDNGDTSYNLPAINNMFGNEEPSVANTFSFDPSQTALINPEIENEVNESGGNGSNFLSSFPNPFTRLNNLLSSITQQYSTEQPESAGGYVDEINDPADSKITALQSLTDGGLGGILGFIIPYISQLASTFGIIGNNLPLVTLLGAVLGPIIATAIASMVIGSVYAGIYISANAIRNEGLDGEMYLLSINRLLNILGIPNPLDDLFDVFGRSFQERSLGSRSLKVGDGQNSSMLTENIANQNFHQCMERMACHAIGKKLVRKPYWKDGWFKQGIRWIAGNVNPESWNWGTSVKHNNNSYYKLIRDGKSLIDAVATGMEPEVQREGENAAPMSVCAKYECDPINFMQNLFKTKTEKQSRLTNT